MNLYVAVNSCHDFVVITAESIAHASILAKQAFKREAMATDNWSPDEEAIITANNDWQHLTYPPAYWNEVEVKKILTGTDNEFVSDVFISTEEIIWHK